MALVKEEQYPKICDAMELQDAKDDPRFADFDLRARNFDALKDIFVSRFLEKTTDDWVKILRDADILAERINTTDDWLKDPHTQDTGIVPEIEHPGIGTIPFPTVPGTKPVGTGQSKLFPGVGEHGSEILSELGLDKATIFELVKEGALQLDS